MPSLREGGGRLTVICPTSGWTSACLMGSGSFSRDILELCSALMPSSILSAVAGLL